MRTRTQTRAAILGLTAGLVLWHLVPPTRSEGIELGSGVEIFGASAAQVRLVRWAIGRFEAAGLAGPPVQMQFHADLRDCDGHLGYAGRGRVDLCTTAVDDMAYHAVLHEMAHLWLDANTSQTMRDRFLRLRGLRSWNETRDPWELRGYEQAAELMAWVLGERIITPKIPDNDPEVLADVFEFLTNVQISTVAEATFPGGSKGIGRPATVQSQPGPRNGPAATTASR
jgi:hypothetical protein